MEELITFIITLAIIIPIVLLIYKASKNESENNYVNEHFNNTPINLNTDPVHEGVVYDKNEPLDKNIFIQQMTYADRKQDSRTDELLNTLDSILFWVRIIGLYFLIKMLISIVTIFATGQAINELIKLL